MLRYVFVTIHPEKLVINVYSSLDKALASYEVKEMGCITEKHLLID